MDRVEGEGAVEGGWQLRKEKEVYGMRWEGVRQLRGLGVGGG